MALNKIAKRLQTHTLPYLRHGYHCAICLGALFFLVQCSEEEFDLTEGQANLGDITLTRVGLSASMRPAKVQEVFESQQRITYRLHSGVADLVIQTDERASGTLNIQLENAHKDLKPQVIRATEVGFNNSFANNCPSLDTPNSVECATNTAEECQEPTISEGEGTTKPLLAVKLFPCQTISYRFGVDPQKREEAMEVVVIGATRRPDVLQKVVDQQTRLGRKTDFFVALGDHLIPEDSRSAGDRIGDLEDQIRAIDEVFVMLPGSLEIEDDRGVAFENAFGAFNARWRVKNTHWVALYSAERETSESGIQRLESLLRATQRQDLAWREEEGVVLTGGQSRILPLVGVTYAPPFDPIGVRNNGWQSRLQASRVMALFSQFGTRALFAGRLPEHHVHGKSPKTHIVSTIEDPDVARAPASYLRIRLSVANTTREQRGGRSVEIERVELE